MSENECGERETGLGSRPVNLARLLEYQQGAIVSRTIVDKKSGTVTLFAFDKGEGLSEHTAPFDAIVYAVEGDADITISGQEAPVTCGEMIIMPANETHAVRASTRFKMLLVMVR